MSEKLPTRENAPKIRVLMSEGSSLSARESLTGLGRAGFHVEVVDANPLCLVRFSKYCRKLHLAPRFGLDPIGYLHRIEELLGGGRFAVLYPAHEQAYLFARRRHRLKKLAGLALPDFNNFERLQSKAGFAEALDELGLPSPPTTIATSEADIFRATRRLPVYVKAAFGTASQSVFCVRSPAELSHAVEVLRPTLNEGVVVQDVVVGKLHRMQGVFADGELVAFHANAQVEAGVGGGDLMKLSAPTAALRSDMTRIGRHLGWSGGLSIDFLLDAAGTPRYIDANPRLAEPGNALAAGLNLPEILARVSLGERIAQAPEAPQGVRSYMALQAVLRAARDGGRIAVLRTLTDLSLGRALFAGAVEELTPTVNDPLAAIPFLAASAALLANPNWHAHLSASTINAYALTPAAIQKIRALEP